MAVVPGLCLVCGFEVAVKQPNKVLDGRKVHLPSSFVMLLRKVCFHLRASFSVIKDKKKATLASSVA